jgi:hypothetical protein
MNNSFLGMIQSAAEDVHPPLYYIILKSVFKSLSILSIPFNKILIAKIVSLIPIVLLLFFNFTKIRKEFGWLSTGIFSFCIVTMPKIMIYGIEIRMYSFALLFVTITLFYAYKIMQKSKLKYWVILTLFTILSAYTHYFAAVSVGIVYLYLFIWCIFKNKKELKKLILATVISTLSYLPWLFSLMDQISTVKEHFWIPPITFETIQSYIWYIFSPNFTGSKGEISSIGILLLILCMILFIIYIFDKNKKYENKFPLFGISLLIATAIFGIIVSFIIRPVFLARYLVPVLGGFWLSFSIILSETYSKKQLFVPLIILLLISGFITTNHLIENEKQMEFIDNEFKNILDNIGKNDIVVHTSFTSHSSISLDSDHIMNEYDNAYYGLENKYSVKKIEKALEENKTVWVFNENLNVNEKNKNFDHLKKNKDYKLEKIASFDPGITYVYPYEIYILSRN